MLRITSTLWKQRVSLLSALVILSAPTAQTFAADSNQTGESASRSCEDGKTAAARFGAEVEKLRLSAKAAGATTNSAAPSSAGKSGNGMNLDDMQDVAFTLQRIHQQAINVFVEATRKKVTRYDEDIPWLTVMPDTTIEAQSAYLPLRKGWLVFFIGTMEPLVQILNDEMKEVDENADEKELPKDKVPEWRAIIQDWKTALTGLNDQLNVCAGMLDDAQASNVEVAKTARAIDRQVTALDEIRRRGGKFLQEVAPAK